MSGFNKHHFVISGSVIPVYKSLVSGLLEYCSVIRNPWQHNLLTKSNKFKNLNITVLQGFSVGSGGGFAGPQCVYR